MLETISWLLGSALLILFILLAGFNFQVMLILPRRLPPGVRGSSSVPVIGGCFGLIGLLTLPLPELRPWFWLPLLLDVGCLPFIALATLARWRQTEAVALLQQTTEITADTIDTRHPQAALARAIAGCLLGTAIGDALGLPFEGLSRRRLARWRHEPLRYQFFFGHGFCSDDTEHACLVAQALLSARSEKDEQWFLHVFRHNLAWRMRFWLLGLPAGIGLATLKSLLKQWLHPLGHVDGVFSAGNAPAMRSALLGVCHGTAPQRLRLLVRAATRLTHTDPRAEHGALAVAAAAHLATQPQPIAADDYLALLTALLQGEDSPLLEAVVAAAASVKSGASTSDFASSIGCGHGVSGFVMHTVPVALHAWLCHPDDYAAAVESAIRCGGDTDTVAAIVGAIVGSRVGPDGIPQEWRERLWEWPRSQRWLEALAWRLADTRPDKTWQGALPLNLPGLLLRNLLFMAWVLLHGLRRLLPPY